MDGNWDQRPKNPDEFNYNDTGLDVFLEIVSVMFYMKLLHIQIQNVKKQSDYFTFSL